MVWFTKLPGFPATFADEPPSIGHVVLFGASSVADPASQRYEKHLIAKGYDVSHTDDAKDLAGLDKGTIVIYLPGPSSSRLAEVASDFCDALVSAAKAMSSSPSGVKLFALIGAEDDRLATAPLYGLARVLNSELPDIWGGLFECEDGRVPITGMNSRTWAPPSKAISVDLSAVDADVALSNAIDQLGLPAVTGVVHAAGVLHGQSIQNITRDAFDSVLAPKIQGAFHLDKLFPPGTLDFFTLFSSCGQLLGFPGQTSYASANAFLDALAERRRSQGDNAVSIQWTSWWGLGMAASTAAVNAELEARGISDITLQEAFMAWDRIASLDMSQAVVLRALPLNAGEQVPHPILADISPRRALQLAAHDGSSGPLGTSEPEGSEKPLVNTFEVNYIRNFWYGRGGH
ncbi:hypothetical protein PG994_008238 [Apiospora phragmitis]|uniref:Ketoreductase domain-containing protein n=1 Tax=Apiospora phragmitis TaxID=2905665 RepID=A0ABR1USJ5_9PEZI